MKHNNTKITLIMNRLDEKILELFRYLINSGTRYIDKLDYNYNRIVYKLQNKEIVLELCAFKKDEERAQNSYSKVDKFFRYRMMSCVYCGFGGILFDSSTDEIGYNLHIEGKIYVVPELGRVEQAQVLDRLDDILEEMESNTLDSILDEFRVNSREEL